MAAFATPVTAPVETVDGARSQSEAAYLRIRERIVSLDMPPGSVVNEGRLRLELRIGRTPIREALQRLARENLVRSIPHRGTFVTDVNITDLARITEVRVVLEGHAARLASERLSGADREALSMLVEVLEDGLKHRTALRNALRRVDSGFLRVGAECAYCPARGDCPAKQGELITSAASLVHKVVGNSLSRTDIAEPGRFHMMLGELSRLAKMARNELQEQVRAGAIIERPDGKTLELIEKTVERVSKSSILKAYGPEEGERILTKLRTDGALTKETHEELRAK